MSHRHFPDLYSVPGTKIPHVLITTILSNFCLVAAISNGEKNFIMIDIQIELNSSQQTDASYNSHDAKYAAKVLQKFGNPGLVFSRATLDLNLTAFYRLASKNIITVIRRGSSRSGSLCEWR